MSVSAGFILSMQTQQRREGICFVTWLATDTGPLKVVSEPQKGVFFVPQSQTSQANSILSGHALEPCSRSLPLKTFADENVTALYFNKLHDYYSARDLLKEEGLRLYEDDIRMQEQYLMERFIRGGVWVRGTPSAFEASSLLDGQFKANDLYTPRLSVLSLDIECSGDGILYSVALANDDVHTVIMIGEPTPNAEPWLEFVEDEVALLRRLCELVTRYDPDLIIGWNVVDFDFQLLCYRAQQLNIPLILGRNNEAVNWRGGKVNKLLVPGRAVLDGIDMLKNATYHFSSYSLDNVAQEVLGEKKLIDNDDKLAKIEQMFLQDKERLAQYNLKDTQLVLAIFKKLELVEFAIARTKLTGLPLERLGGSVAAFTNLYLPHLHRSGYVAPNMAEHGLSFDSPGGYVMDSTPGLYENVAVLDFKSLYPSIIRTFCIDPLGLILGLKDSEASIEGFNGGHFARTGHHLPQLVGDLALARQQAKDVGDHHLQQAIKIIMNSLYGVLGSKGCRFYDPRLSSSITLRGHQIMQTTKQWLEEMGATVIYGDTDSTFVALPNDLDEQQSHEMASQLVSAVNHKWQQKIHDEYGVQSYLELEYESLYRPFLMPKARHKDIGSKKRYAGLLVQADHKLIFKGMESVRSDWTELAREFQTKLFLALFTQQNLNEVVEQYVNELQDLHDVNRVTYRKRLGKNPDQYIKTIPPHVKAAQNSPKKFTKGDWVDYVITLKGPELVPPKTALDLEHYLEKQLTPIVEDLRSVGIAIELSKTHGQFSLI
ncbi:DNA polymerase II [Pseudoalteromonas pernae]|uniref:DNA polymerase II n=1 Tax=Pseudoalteromonas pernae TaxID=3118054 RepID=UPI003241EC20